MTSKIIDYLQRFFAAEYIEKYTILLSEYELQKRKLSTSFDKITELDKALGKATSELIAVQADNRELQSIISQLPQIPKEDPLETYWNTKRESTNLTYAARDGIDLDPRIFFQPFSRTVIFKGSNDEIAKAAINWAILNRKYISDNKENWQFVHETQKRKSGDCEDVAIEIANILINSGVPYWRVRLNAGWVAHPSQEGKQIGHAFVTYLRESDNKWVILDWCYWADKNVVNLRKLWKTASKYFSIWFSWNTKYIFKDDQIDR